MLRLVVSILFVHKYMVANCLEIMPERAMLSYENPKYVKDPMVTVRRYSRRSSYVLNIAGNNLHTWGNNITVEIKFFEFLHNEYRPTFVELNYKLCKLILEEPTFGAMIHKTVPECPIPPGYHVMPNMSFLSMPTLTNLRYKWPFTKGKAQLSLWVNGKIPIVEGYAILSFTNNARRKNPKPK